MILDSYLFLMTPYVVEKLFAHHSMNSWEWGVWFTEKKWKNDLKTPQVSLPWSLRASSLPLAISIISFNRIVSNILAIFIYETLFVLSTNNP